MGEKGTDQLVIMSANKMMTPQSSLLKYDSPVLISKNNDESINQKPKPKVGRLEPIDVQKAEEILPKILPPIVFEKDGQLWNQKSRPHRPRVSTSSALPINSTVSCYS